MLADRYGAQLRLTRLRPSGRGADVWDELHPTAAQQRELYEWLLAHGENVLTGDSFFHLGGYGAALPGLNLCGAGRVVCLIDPIGDVYACPFVIHDEFLAGNVREPGGFAQVWRESELFTRCASPGTAGACASCGLFDKCRGGAWPRSSSPGCRWPGPTRSACSATASGCSPSGRTRAFPSHRSTCREGRPDQPRLHALRSRARSRSCVRREAAQRNPWFESVAVAQRRAKRRLPKSVYSALIAGSEAGVTLADNLAAFSELGFAPHVATCRPRGTWPRP